MPKNDGWFWDIPVALVLLTRLPLPNLPERAFTAQARAGWAFPLAGLVVGAIAAGVGAMALMTGLPPTLVAGLIIGVQIMLTGAMHEDGLADTADGLWGGWTVDRRLEIMKDSHIGSYGVLALIIGTGLRWMAVATLLDAEHGSWWWVVAVASLSRAPLPTVMTVLPRARPGGLSDHVGAPGPVPSLVAVALGLLVGALICGWSIVLPIGVAALFVLAFALVARRKIGGQTGDILGATQQVAEIALWLSLAASL